MSRLQELREAKDACQRVLGQIDTALDSLKSASNWGILDLLGGGLFSSMLKRDRIRDVNSVLEAIGESLQVLSRELADVQMTLPRSISDRMQDVVFDSIFDNVFTDLRVQGEIKETRSELERLQSSMQVLDAEIDREMARLQ